MNTKPFGGKAYGSTPHLPGSRVGPGDHHCHEGQERICTTKARDRHDRIIVTEKLDGGNVAVGKKDGRVVALGRAGYLAASSPYVQHHYFAQWVSMHEDRFAELLAEGEMVNGEWLALAHGTRYSLRHEPFVAFSMAAGKKRIPWDEVLRRCSALDVVTAAVLHDGGPLSIEQAKELIAVSRHGALDPVEGAVWRVESRGEFDFLAKWVSPEKQDGKYLTDITGHPEIWHWTPEKESA